MDRDWRYIAENKVFSPQVGDYLRAFFVRVGIWGQGALNLCTYCFEKWVTAKLLPTYCLRLSIPIYKSTHQSTESKRQKRLFQRETHHHKYFIYSIWNYINSLCYSGLLRFWLKNTLLPCIRPWKPPGRPPAVPAFAGSSALAWLSRWLAPLLCPSMPL